MTTLPVDPRTLVLRSYLAGLSNSLDDLADAICAINDPEWRDAFDASIKAGKAVASFHAEVVHPSIADDLVSIRSQFARHMVPREDPQLGPLESLRRIRAARGSLLAEIDEMLAAASDLGVRPSESSIELPPAIEFERAGFELLLKDFGRKLRAVEDGLKQVEAEGRPEAAPDVRQRGLVNFYVNNMTVELALAKVETSVKAVVDIASLGRAIEMMGELTRDFVRTVIGMSRVLTESLNQVAKAMAPKVRSLSTGLRAMVRKVSTSQRVGTVTSASNEPGTSSPEDQEFNSLIDQGNFAYLKGNLAAAKMLFDAAMDVAIEQLQKKPTASKYRGNVALSSLRLGAVESSMGHLDPAREYFTKAHSISEGLALSEPGHSVWQSYQWASLKGLGKIDNEQDKLREARQRYTAALTIAESQSRTDNAEWQKNLSETHCAVGIIDERFGNNGSARGHYVTALTISEKLIQKYPTISEYKKLLWAAQINLGDIELANGNLEGARGHFEKGLAIAEMLLAEEPEIALNKRSIWVSFWKMATLKHPSFPWSRVLAILEEMQSAGTLEPADSKWIEMARGLAASSPSAG